MFPLQYDTEYIYFAQGPDKHVVNKCIPRMSKRLPIKSILLYYVILPDIHFLCRGAPLWPLGVYPCSRLLQVYTTR